MDAFIHGFILAFGLILPLGAQNVFVFQQGALQPTYRHALPVVITAGLCDTLLISLAVTGVSALILTIPMAAKVLVSIGIFFLLYMGWLTWKSQSNGVSDQGNRMTAKQQMVFAASVSLLNPHAILDTIGVIGTSSIQYTGSEKITFAISCIAVSWVWFASLAYAGKLVRHLDSNGLFLTILNKVSALIIWTVAVYLFLRTYM